VLQIVECCGCSSQWNEVYNSVYRGIADINEAMTADDIDDE
jgi:hypothetical protein